MHSQHYTLMGAGESPRQRTDCDYNIGYSGLFGVDHKVLNAGEFT